MTLLQARHIERAYYFKEIYGPCIVVGNHTILSDGLLLLHPV
jgi:1-acyl-sn-glycerol-3-phosphate acyltransferase